MLINWTYFEHFGCIACIHGTVYRYSVGIQFRDTESVYRLEEGIKPVAIHLSKRFRTSILIQLDLL